MKANLTLIVDSYWSSLSHLSNDVKLHLIAKLSESLIQTPVKKTTENLAFCCAGNTVSTSSTAITYKMIMVTDNLKHFERLSSIKIENWVNRV